MKGAHDSMEDWVIGTVCKILDEEISSLSTSALNYPQDKLSEESLLAICFDKLISQAKELVLMSWELFHVASQTSEQKSWNTMKVPDTVGIKFHSLT